MGHIIGLQFLVVQMTLSYVSFVRYKNVWFVFNLERKGIVFAQSLFNSKAVAYRSIQIWADSNNLVHWPDIYLSGKSQNIVLKLLCICNESFYESVAPLPLLTTDYWSFD